MESVEDRIKSQGDRVSQVVWALTEEWGALSVTELADVIGCSRRMVYKYADQGGIEFTKGRKPKRVSQKAA